MDLITLENTSTYAIEAVYRYLWNFIPNKYKLPEDDKCYADLEPFYDPELTFDNRLHYKLTHVSYTKRSQPWFVITWNTENGLLKSDLSQRRFQTSIFDCDDAKYRCKFINTNMSINFGICSNTMQGLFELQENLVLKIREKLTCTTKKHPILGSFPVSLNVIDGHQNKLQREQGTLCYLFLQCRIDYPIIGNVEKIESGIIKEIELETNKDIADLENKITISKDIVN